MTLVAAIAAFVIFEQRVERKIDKLELRVVDLETAYVSKHQGAPDASPVGLRVCNNTIMSKFLFFYNFYFLMSRL